MFRNLTFKINLQQRWIVFESSHEIWMSESQPFVGQTPLLGAGRHSVSQRISTVEQTFKLRWADKCPFFLRKNTYTVLVPFQFRNLVSFYCFEIILKTVFREMIWADNWRAWRRPFGSLCIHKRYPNSSFNRYRRVITPERYLVQQDTFIGISGVWTIVNYTSRRHNFKEKLYIFV